jgi:hypothetical protein
MQKRPISFWNVARFKMADLGFTDEQPETAENMLAAG